ncbi:MAG: beta-hydroxyacyl-ACP dehydratase [Pirellulaceae bacterium]|nr:beta-hydroxyacyl-ACP dehydratase [Pirellulaceae bacterium]
MTDPLRHGLPHREPFIFVHDVVEHRPGESAVCESVFPASTPFFAGHFPGHPIVPGVILTEALAQTAGIAAGEECRRRSFFLTAIRQMKFFGPVHPEEKIRFSASKTTEAGGLLQFAVAAETGGRKVAEGVIVLSETAAV